ncbi:MAG: hypothetical protein WBP93_15055 [Pyrinomonadaceae bacterium]
MGEEHYTKVKRSGAATPGKTFDSAYGFSFAIALGLLLFIAGLVLMLALGMGTGVGLVFGLPLLLAGLIVPLFMVRDIFTRNEISGPCPYCGTNIMTTDATLKMNCPACKKIISVHDLQFHQTEDATINK